MYTILTGEKDRKSYPDFFVLFFFDVDFFFGVSSSESDEKTFLRITIIILIKFYFLMHICMKDNQSGGKSGESKVTYFSRAASRLTISSGSIPLSSWDSSCDSMSIASSTLTSFFADFGVNFSAHFFRLSLPSRTTLQGDQQ